MLVLPGAREISTDMLQQIALKISIGMSGFRTDVGIRFWLIIAVTEAKI
jgi:hypothetical protein